LFGYELIKTRKLNDTLEQHLGNLLRSLKANCVIDVGANTGQYGRILRKLGFEGRIVSFEPQAHAFAELLQASAGDDSWHVHQVALGREEEVREMNIFAAHDFSSFLDPNDFSRKQFRHNVEITERQSTAITTLSAVAGEVLKDISQPRVFLKLDTQGFDLEFFHGATEMLPVVVGLQS
jgi:FkbM family methyltransferase